MPNHYQRIVVNKKLYLSNSWDSTDLVISDARGVEVRTGIGKTKDQFSFKVNNANGKYYYKYFNGDASTVAFTLDYAPPTEYLNTDRFRVYVADLLQVYTTNYSVSGTTLTFVSAPASGFRNIRVDFEVIGPDDKVAIWLWSGSALHDGFAQLTSTQQNLVRRLDGVITVPKSSSDDRQGEEVSVEGVGFIETIFSALAFVPGGLTSNPLSGTGNTGSTAGSMVKWVVNLISNYNQNRRILWDEANTATTKEVSYSATYKPGIEIIEELSADEYTANGQFIYWVDFNVGSNAYYFHWKAKSGSVVGSIVKGENANNIEMKRDVDGTINAIIYNCGQDPDGVGMEFLNFDPTVQTSYGARWKYVTSTYKIGEELIETEFQNRQSVWDRDTLGSSGTVRRVGNYPNSGSLATYGSMSFTKRTDAGSISSQEYNITSRNLFREAIWREAWGRGREATQRIIQLYSNPRITGTIVEPVTGSYALGEIRAVTYPDFNMISKNIRVTNIKYDLWKTQVDLEEDETTT